MWVWFWLLIVLACCHKIKTCRPYQIIITCKNVCILSAIVVLRYWQKSGETKQTNDNVERITRHVLCHIMFGLTMLTMCRLFNHCISNIFFKIKKRNLGHISFFICSLPWKVCLSIRGKKISIMTIYSLQMGSWF